MCKYENVQMFLQSINSQPSTLNSQLNYRPSALCVGAVIIFCLHEHREDTCDYCKQCNTFYEGCSKNHVGTDVVHGFRLTGDSFYRAFTNLTDTDTCSDGSETGTNGSAGICPGSCAQQYIDDK
jgi:hypothetical protein